MKTKDFIQLLLFPIMFPLLLLALPFYVYIRLGIRSGLFDGDENIFVSKRDNTEHCICTKDNICEFCIDKKRKEQSDEVWHLAHQEVRKNAIEAIKQDRINLIKELDEKYGNNND